MLLLAASVSLLALLLSGVRPDLAARIADHRGYVAILLGLALVAGGGILASLAQSVPGREGAARLGLTAAGAGLFAAAALGAVLSRGWTQGAEAVPLAAAARCIGVAALLALAPSIALLAYLVRAAPSRPGAIAATGGAGAVAVGALTVHLTCPATETFHLVLSHALAPVIGGLLLVLPLRAVLLRAEHA